MLARLNTTVPNGTRLVIIDQTTADPIYGVSQAQSAANFRAMVISLRSRNIKTVLADLRPIYSRGLVQPDRIHLSARGHYAAAAMLLPQVIAAISK
jgi:acyl-CoA thioesterase-1